MPTVVGIVATAITPATATPPATEQTIAPSDPFVPFVNTRQLIVGNWIKTRAKDLITGQCCSNDARRGSINNKEPGISRIVNNNSQTVKHYTAFPSSDYWTPLNSQVKELGSSHEHATHQYITPSLGDSNGVVFDT